MIRKERHGWKDDKLPNAMIRCFAEEGSVFRRFLQPKQSMVGIEWYRIIDIDTKYE
jgi:hypothetical protein